MDIEEKLKNIKKYVKDDVTLICVSKTKPMELIKKVYDLGERNFGENKVQEFLTKYDELPKDIKWHFIGTLQKNKVKYIVDKVSLLHSLDSIDLLEELEKKCQKKQCTINALIQINMGREENKHGILEEQLDEFLKACTNVSNVFIKGLMIVIPKGNEESCRKYFKQAYTLFSKQKGKSLNNISMEILSMGMSNDYIYAVEEGSNMVRIGQEIFGERIYK